MRLGTLGIDHQTIVGDSDAIREEVLIFGVKFLIVAATVLQRAFVDLFDVAIRMRGLVVEDDELFDLCAGGELDCGYVVRVPPVALGSGGFLEGVLPVEDEHVGVAEEIHERVVRLLGLGAMLGVGGVDDGFAVLFESIAPGIAGVLLLDGADGDVAHFKGVAGLADVELDVCLHCLEGDGEARCGHLCTYRSFGLGVEAVKDDSIAGDVSGGEKGETLYVIPV